MFSSSAPVSFATDDDQNAPVRYNERPYRGRIEVFTNLRGTLTVVNELGLEDYVRGVVANELSPGGYPAIEAQKAQAIAARTYALKNRGQFMSQGFDILPTTRSQVYRGLTSENPIIDTRCRRNARHHRDLQRRADQRALHVDVWRSHGRLGKDLQRSDSLFARA